LNNNGEVSDAAAVSGSAALTEATVTNAQTVTFRDARSTVMLVYLFEIDGACTGPDTFFRLGAGDVIRITTCSEDAIR
jgi:hypothetical protein